MSILEVEGPSPRRTLRFLAIALVLSILLGAGMLAPSMGRTTAVTSSPPTPSLTQEERAAMEDMYSPVFSFSGGERTFPVDVEYFIGHCRLMGVLSGRSVEHPSPEDLGGAFSTGYYLDHSGGTRNDGGAIGIYELDRGDVGQTVYVRTAEREGAVIIQYWLFYVFNQGTYNSHEGDWEMVQVILDRKELDPLSLTLSRHHEGSRTPWASLAEVDLVGTHPVIRVAAGSHAHYLPSDALRAPGDRADGRGEVLWPSDYRLVPIGQEANGTISPSWLQFQGSWGETAAWGNLLGTGGPPGPMYRENGLMWAGLGWGA